MSEDDLNESEDNQEAFRVRVFEVCNMKVVSINRITENDKR